MHDLIIVAVAAFAGCAAAGLAGHWYSIHALTVYFDELESRLQPTVHEIKGAVVAAEHKVCSICNSLVARYEESKGKVVCANCKGKN